MSYNAVIDFFEETLLVCDWLKFWIPVRLAVCVDPYKKQLVS